MRDIYQDVTDKIVTALDQGVAPWIKPWSSSGSVHVGHHHPYPINAITRRPYSGINLPLLWAEARLQGFTQDRWLTFNQAKKAGGHIRKGEHSTLAILYKPMEREEQTESGQPIFDEDGQPRVIHFGILRMHFLFNIEQTEGLEAFNETPLETEPRDPFQANNSAENVLLGSGAKIVHRPAAEAFYHPLRDFIQLPKKAQFHNEGGYYATALHELTHWTGHSSRLQRGGITSPCPFGSPGYAFEELVAEMGAAFLCAYVGIQGELRHESYIDSWLNVLKADKRAIFRASGQARAASEYVLNLKQQLEQTILEEPIEQERQRLMESNS
ncbi:zincin-like metallopeptidase domain-containing protein [Pseudomonas chlororaphis]|uniref:ArdC family protein n=1 Tax=Pseudomonas chlororaphis TaxID=587753 RepID=UPI002367C059|nr:zincin-like metallopeptidase domain-containing protein [Pseudomonas chlororaphis]WDG77534.1 zincin-like metallopeptidase domain-containing protein [Pseudomonas chlororaphis]WDG83227.1 zincin-like metallopeptidase domain-containing protein [Pseudomonas chlororaphis]